MFYFTRNHGLRLAAFYQARDIVLPVVAPSRRPFVHYVVEASAFTEEAARSTASYTSSRLPILMIWWSAKWLMAVVGLRFTVSCSPYS